MESFANRVLYKLKLKKRPQAPTKEEQWRARGVTFGENFHGPDSAIDYFKDADDVSCPGEVFPVDSTRGWFQTRDTGKYKEFIDYTVWMHGGIYYVRKTPRVKEFYQTCRDAETLKRRIKKSSSDLNI